MKFPNTIPLPSFAILKIIIIFLITTVFQDCYSGSERNKQEKAGLLPKAKPEEMQMSGITIERITEELESRVSSGEITAAQVLVARSGSVVLEQEFGKMSRVEDALPIRLDSPFLVASITKPFTAIAVMQLVEDGKINLDDPVGKYIPEFTGGERDRIVVRNLLNHTSGLPDMLPENTELRRQNTPPKKFIPLVISTPLLFSPGTKVKYQSMGINLCGEIVEKITGMPLRDFMKKEIFDPFGMNNTFLGTDGRELSTLVECDVDDAAGDPGCERWDWNSIYWRDFGAPWGGLHSTAGDLAIILQAMLNGGEYKGNRILKESTVNEMIRNQAQGMNSPWGIGWGFKKSLDWTYFGDEVSESTFGHCGATGTVFWADPVRQVLFVCLTSRPLDEHKGQLFNHLSDLVVEAIDGRN